jgi:hypothetical protein
MPPTVNMPPGMELPSAGGPPPITASMRALSIPPVSSVPPGGTQQDPQLYGQNSYPNPNTYPPASASGQAPVSGHDQMAFLAGASPFGAAPAATPGPPERPAGTGQYVLAIGVGVLLAVLIGVGGFYVWRGRRAPTVDTSSASATASAAVAVPTPVPVPVPASGSTETPAASAAPTVVSADIVFRIDPADATLSVEGKDLGGDVRTVPRPAMGKTVNVVARSKDHEDTTILVDYFTSSPMELTLKPAGAAAAVTAGAGDIDKEPPKEPAKQPVRGGGGDGTRPRQPAKGDQGGLPANPY